MKTFMMRMYTRVIQKNADRPNEVQQAEVALCTTEGAWAKAMAKRLAGRGGALRRPLLLRPVRWNPP